jgi:hypothetical protein
VVVVVVVVVVVKTMMRSMGWQCERPGAGAHRHRC